MLQKGHQLLEAGRLDDAKSVYHAVLKEVPEHSELLHIVGLIENELGNYEAAEAYLCKAISNEPAKQVLYIHLGQFYTAHKKTDNALKAYKKALLLNPDNPEVFCLIGDTYKRCQLFEEAVRWYQKATECKPELSCAYNNLGNCYQALHDFKKAMKCFQHALHLNANDAGILHNLGNVYSKLGLLDRAIACYQNALHQSPEYAKIYNSLGAAYQKKRDYKNAAEAYEKALRFDPENYLIHYNIATNLMDQGNLTESLRWFKKTLKINPGYQPALVHSRLSLPIIYSKEAEIEHYRKAYTKGLDTLVNDWNTNKNHQIHLAGLSCWTNFFLPYQGKDDLGLQKKFGQYLTSVMKANYPDRFNSKYRLLLTRGDKIRVGYVSKYMCSHTVGKLFVGWIENANPREFEIYCYHTGNQTDTITERFKKASFKFHRLVGDIDRMTAQIAVDKLHILVFLDIGMNATTQLLSAMRSAPVQCVAWGHPLTTGLPSIDYFLSSDFMEPLNGQDHYCENLVRLPNLSIYYHQPQLPQNPKKRNEFGLGDDDFVYLSTQSLFKYLPQDDFIYAQIALSVARAKFVFIGHESQRVTETFKRRLKCAFRKLGLNSEEFCCFQPRLSHADFLSLNLGSEVLLDPPAWSGGMTSLEGISCCLPVVTLPGKFMRGRHTYAMLKFMDITETIAVDKDDYIQIAVRLGLDQQFYAGCKQAIADNLHHLYKDKDAVRGIENFYKSLL